MGSLVRGLVAVAEHDADAAVFVLGAFGDQAEALQFGTTVCM